MTQREHKIVFHVQGRGFVSGEFKPREQVRALLREKGVFIPDDTWFVGGYHDTTSELVPAPPAQGREARRTAGEEVCTLPRGGKSAGLPFYNANPSFVI